MSVGEGLAILLLSDATLAVPVIVGVAVAVFVTSGLTVEEAEWLAGTTEDDGVTIAVGEMVIVGVGATELFDDCNFF